MENNKSLVATADTGVTVRDVCGLLKDYSALYLVVDGGCVDFNPALALSMEAYGNFVVDGIYTHDIREHNGDVEYELHIAHAPLRRA